MEAFAIPFLLFVGALLALQAAANVQLTTAMGSPFGASTLQLGIGATLLLAVAAVAGSLGAFGGLDNAEPWHLIGGLGSAVYITAGIVLFPRLGAVLTVGLWIAGQMLASLLLDGFGWLGVDAEPLGAREIAGGARGAVGAALIVRAQAGRGARPAGLRERGGWLALAVLAGAALPVQGAINAELRSELDATIAVGAVSFVVATAGMALLLVASLSIADAPRPRIEPPAADALVGLARRPRRGALRHGRVLADPGDRRGADDRPDRRRPAGRVGARRSLRAPSPAAATDPAARLAGVGALLAGVVLIQAAWRGARRPDAATSVSIQRQMTSTA